MKSSTDAYEHNEEKVRFIQQLANTDGKLESPIDLNISRMKVIELNPLRWVDYDLMPKKLKLTNTGYTVILSAKWHAERPYLCGGPFASNYVFSQIHFHWGETDINGSEHRADGESMPMELHAVHFKSEYETVETALRRDNGVTILVYLLQLQADHNPFLDEIIKALSLIRMAHSSIRLTPFLITNIMQCFQRDYFLYWGSIKMVHYMNSILWLISREPLGISMKQIAEFRSLYNKHKMPLLTNRRPLRDTGDRNVFHVCPSGSRYATLLAIPRDYGTVIREGDVDNNDGHKQ